jgi:hypothetical protein
MVSSADSLLVSADEILDISSVEEFNIGVRYGYRDKIRKDFLQFEPLRNVTGQGLEDTLLECFERYILEMKFLEDMSIMMLW